MEGSLNSLNMKRAVKSGASSTTCSRRARRIPRVHRAAEIGRGPRRGDEEGVRVGSRELDALWEKWVKATTELLAISFVVLETILAESPISLPPQAQSPTGGRQKGIHGKHGETEGHEKGGREENRAQDPGKATAVSRLAVSSASGPVALPHVRRIVAAQVGDPGQRFLHPQQPGGVAAASRTAPVTVVKA